MRRAPQAGDPCVRGAEPEALARAAARQGMLLPFARLVLSRGPRRCRAVAARRRAPGVHRRVGDAAARCHLRQLDGGDRRGAAEQAWRGRGRSLQQPLGAERGWRAGRRHTRVGQPAQRLLCAGGLRLRRCALPRRTRRRIRRPQPGGRKYGLRRTTHSQPVPGECHPLGRGARGRAAPGPLGPALGRRRELSCQDAHAAGASEQLHSLLPVRMLAGGGRHEESQTFWFNSFSSLQGRT
mmetsp:Transcript_69866/g.191688  ORF Transcript_69866/g.191688 Transcript_69866/m.191688 type:complete len:239 (-) Transcript_69866:58-774(-)